MKRLLESAAVLILLLLMAGCVRHRWLEVEPGEYTQVRGTDEASRAVARHIRALSVDRDAGTATINLDDGSQIPLALAPRERSEWPEGCPTNILSHHMEVLDVEESDLAIASVTFQEPVLVRNCPGEPQEIVLREAGSIGDAGSACRDSCLVFGRAGTSTTEASLLGQWQGAGYTFLRVREGPSLMFWYEDPATARCQTQTTPEDQLTQATCSAETAAGQRIEWGVTAAGTREAEVTISGQSYHLDQGRLFLITTRDGAISVLQLDRDLAAVEPEEASIIAFAESVPEILQLARAAAGPEEMPLAHSEKGYELYSWQEPEDALWHYTLVTGTNRQKTAEELLTEENALSNENALTEDGWVKLTVTGTEALLELLARLPRGEQIFWHGAVAAPAGADSGQFRLPEEAVVDTTDARCRELSLELIVVADELEAILALPETVPTQEPVLLTFTLLNHARYPLYVLEWYTPLEGIAGEIFRVTRDGQVLPYEGILAMRGDPGPENYVLLPPGGSVTATVDLVHSYALTEPGTYAVTFLSPRISDVARSEAEMAQTVDELGPVSIVSNTVTVTVLPGE